MIIDVISLLNAYNNLMRKSNNNEITLKKFLYLIQDFLFEGGYFWENLGSSYLNNECAACCKYIRYAYGELTYSSTKSSLLAKKGGFDATLNDILTLKAFMVHVEMPFS